MQATYSNRNNPPRSHLNRYGSSESLPISYAPPGISIRSQRTEIPPTAPNAVVNEQPGSIVSQQPTINLNEKKVERILIFYTDGSFREYAPTVV